MFRLIPGRDRCGPPPITSSANVERTGEGRRPRILLVEDDYFVALELEHQLSSAGFEVIGIAATAEDAIKIGRSENPDVAIMDIRLAGHGDGVDAAIELFTTAGIRSIFVTAHGDAQTRRRAAQAHPLGWVQKPYRPDSVIELVNSVFDQRN
jgi:two-component system, response regulator PdtaR